MTSTEPTVDADGSETTPDAAAPSDTTPPEDHSEAVAANTGGETFAALRHRTYALLFASGTMMFFAIQGTMVARGWLAKQSNTALGGVMFGFGISMTLMSLPGGVLADRLGKKRVIAVSYVLLAGSSLWLGVAVTTDTLAYWMLVTASAVQGAAFSLMAPARMAFTAELVPRRDLPNAIALSQVSLNSMKAIGPWIGGVVLALDDAHGAAWLYYGTVVLSVVSLAMMIPLPPGDPGASVADRRPLGDITDGLRYVFARRELAIVVTTSLVVVMMGFPFVSFLVRIATELLDGDAADFGLLSSAQGVGALIAALFVASRIHGRNGWPLQTVGGLGFGLGLMAIAASPNVAAALVAVGFVGAANVWFQTANNSLALMIAEPAYHGRVQSFVLLSFGAFGLAALPLGVLADAIGLRPTLVVMGTTVAAATTAAALARPRSARR